MRSPASAGAAGPSASPAVSQAVRGAASGGLGLPQPFRGEMEGAFGRSLSEVRLHADSDAVHLNHELHAHAFTHRNHIFFGAGRYDTDSGAGRRLIAHELVHVLQDRDGAGGIHRQSADSHSHATESDINVAAASGVPFEKWAPEIERQYRLRGDSVRANAIRSCRTNGDGACDLLLTNRQMFTLYALGKESQGDQGKVLAGLPAISVGLAKAAETAAKRAPLRLVPPPAEPVPGPAAGLGAAEVIPGVALLALLTAEVIALMSLAAFQAKLAEQGFIVLEDPEGLCHGGCHISPREESGSPFGGLTFPDLDRETLDQFFGQKQAPTPVPETKPKEQEKKPTCASEHPSVRLCQSLPGRYTYRSPQAALNALKKMLGDENLKFGKRETTTDGPCPGEGLHINVRSGGEQPATIVCCPCCEDTPGGPAKVTRCGILLKR